MSFGGGGMHSELLTPQKLRFSLLGARKDL